MALSVTLNGHTRLIAALAEGATLDQVIAELGLKADRIAVEQNGEIVARSGWSSAIVQSNDRLEVVHFVGGGGSQSSNSVKVLDETFAKLPL